ncbi:MAG TPA: ATP synthase F1 subunit epsilon [Patescibacteria group bacterium]|nr:ATP synthase F1 subunit epsilon [Patescibacteria group bacterium]
MAKKLKLIIVTQERELLNVEIDQVTVPTSSGQVTILPDHSPLFTQLQTGELIYKAEGKPSSVVVSSGFMDVAPNNVVTILSDTATLESDITIAKAEEAKRKAEESMAQKQDRRSFIVAEASLRKALVELKIARKRSTPTSFS